MAALLAACGWEDNKYDGEMNENGERHGVGKITFSNGSIYTGEVRHNRLCGQGMMVDMHGNVYEGLWENDKRHGGCRYTAASGDVFVGQYINNKRQGQGIEVFAETQEGLGLTLISYEGNFENGDWSGQGTLTFRNGDIYKGKFKDGEMHGLGCMTYADGRVEDGLWEEGDFIA